MLSLRALLEGIVDYAGLFPPAGLPMGPAVGNYAHYRHGEQAWMLGRFVVPASRLDEFATFATGLLPHDGEQAWPLSVLAGEDAAEAVERLVGHRNGSAGGGAAIVSLEMKAGTPDEIRRGLAVVPDDMELFFELPADGDIAALIEVLRGTDGRAKIRTGGVTEEAIPGAVELARFVVACAGAGVPFKATAGLHHPLRGIYPLTYEKDAPRGAMFGYINLFTAAAFAAAGRLSEDGLATLLVESDATRFEFDDHGLSWRGERLTLDDIRDTRSSFALSYGSCSFTEPVEDLREMRLLPNDGQGR